MATLTAITERQKQAKYQLSGKMWHLTELVLSHRKELGMHIT